MSSEPRQFGKKIVIALVSLVVSFVITYLVNQGVLWILNQVFDIMYDAGPGNIGLVFIELIVQIVVAITTFLASLFLSGYWLQDKLLRKEASKNE